MKKRSRISSLRAETDRKVHYKMFKDGKHWVFAGLATTFFVTLPFLQTNTVQADTTSDLNNTEAVAEAGDSVTTPSDTAILETKATAEANISDAPAVPDKALLEIQDAKAVVAEDGVVTITGKTTSNAEVVATADDGSSQTVTAGEDGAFSIKINATGSVILKSSLDGHTSEPTAVVVPAVEASTENAVASSPSKAPVSAATTATTKTVTDAAGDVSPDDEDKATPATSTSSSESPESAAADHKSAAASSTSTVTAGNTTATEEPSLGTVDPLVGGTTAAVIGIDTDDSVTLVNPSADEIAAAKQQAVERYKQTGTKQLINLDYS